MSEVLVTTKWLNLEALFPRFEEHKRTIEAWKDVSSLLTSIKAIDSRAVSVFQVRNWQLPQVSWSHTRYSILAPQIQQLVYWFDGTIKNESPILIAALQKVARVMMTEVEKFLQDWDMEDSWERKALTLWLIDEWEKRFNEWLNNITFRPVPNEVFQAQMMKLGRYIVSHSEAEIEDIILRLGSLNGNQSNFDWFREWVQETVPLILSNTKTTIKNAYDWFDNFDNWWEQKNKWWEITWVWLPLIRIWVLVAVLQQWLTHWKDYYDWHKHLLENLVATESQSFWEWEWERKRDIIESELLPILAQAFYNINRRWVEIDYNDWMNQVIYMSSHKIANYGANRSSSAECVKIDINGIFNINYTIGQRFITDDTFMRDGRERQVRRLDCELTPQILTDLWVYNNPTFLFRYINHPEFMTRVRVMSATLWWEEDIIDIVDLRQEEAEASE